MKDTNYKNWFYIWVLDSSQDQKKRLAGRSNDKNIALETAKRQADIQDQSGKKQSLLVLDQDGNEVALFHPQES